MSQPERIERTSEPGAVVGGDALEGWFRSSDTGSNDCWVDWESSAWTSNGSDSPLDESFVRKLSSNVTVTHGHGRLSALVLRVLRERARFERQAQATHDRLGRLCATHPRLAVSVAAFASLVTLLFVAGLVQLLGEAWI